MTRLLWVCFGGALGTGVRYLLTLWLASRLGPGPYGTLAVNIVGSFLLCVILGIGLATTWMPATLISVLGTGVMGGFTTYSSFNYEVLRLFDDRNYRACFSYLLTTLFGCLIAGALGLALARRITTP
jgi:CrcB protein